MQTCAAELCLHLARRLTAGDGDRKRLVDRGINHCQAADDLVIASNGMIKHILAHEANKEVLKDLLELATADVAVPRKVIYDNTSNCSQSSSMDKKSVSLASRFIIKDDGSSKNDGSGSTSNNHHSDIVKRKVVSFSPIHVSSLGSGGNSNHSNDQSSN